MDPTPPPPPTIPAAPTPKFTLPISAWVVWALYAVAGIALFVWRREAATPETIGELAGNIMAALVLPTLLAWVAWRLARRSATTLRVTFFVAFGVGVLGQLVQFSQRVQANVALEKMADESRRIQAAQREALAKGQPIDETKARELAQRASKEWEQVAQNSSGQRRVTAEAGKAYLDQLLAIKARYDGALAKVDAPTFWDLSRHQTAAEIGQTRAAVKAFAAANRELAAQQDRDGSALRRELEQRGATAEVTREAVEGYRKNAPRLELMAQIREADGDFVGVMTSFLDLAEANLGKLKKDEATGHFTFASEAAARRAGELMQEADRIGARQEEIQKQVFGTKP